MAQRARTGATTQQALLVAVILTSSVVVELTDGVYATLVAIACGVVSGMCLRELLDGRL